MHCVLVAKILDPPLSLTVELYKTILYIISYLTVCYIAPDHLVPVISKEYYQSGFFRYAGQLIAMSILHGGLGMVGLARSLATFMVTDDIELGSCHLTIEDVIYLFIYKLCQMTGFLQRPFLTLPVIFVLL